MTKNQKIYAGIGGGVVVLAFAFVFIAGNNGNGPAKLPDTGTTPVITAATPAKTATFSGTISAVDTGCFSDAVCSVTIDGKKIILVQGGRGLPPDTIVGKLLGVNSVGDLEGKIGAFANVFAELTPDGNYTIYGNSNYFVEVTATSGK